MKTKISLALKNKRNNAKSYKALSKVAQKAIKDTIALLKAKGEKKPKIFEFCGPISTGGLGNVQDNIKELHNAINQINRLGYHIFNQVPFEKKIGEVKAKRQPKIGDAYDMKLLYDFYEPIFKKKMIDLFIFLPDWQSSTGANWEYKQAKKLGIKTRQLKDTWKFLLAGGEKDIKKLTFKI